LQLGSLGLTVSAAIVTLLWLRAEQPRVIFARVLTFGITATISFLAVFTAGELALRWIYRDGMSFWSYRGPLVERFERWVGTVHADVSRLVRGRASTDATRHRHDGATHHARDRVGRLP
jgi:hypothetical protein